MKIEARFLVGLGVVFAALAVSYFFLAHEPAGVAMLVGAVGLGLLPGSYYLWWSHHMKPRPEDDEDATIEDNAGTIESFPGSSIWPFVLGMGAFAAALTFVFGLWLAPIAAVLIVTAAIGGTVESRRGGAV